MNDKPIVVTISTGTILRTVAILIAVFLAFLLKDILLVIFTSVVIASFVEVGANRFRDRYHIPRSLTVGGIYTISLIGIAFLAYFIVPVVISQTADFVQSIARVLPNATELQVVQQSTQSLQGFLESATPTTLIDIFGDVRSFATSFSSSFFSSLLSVFGSVLNLVLIIIISFYLSMQRNGVGLFLRAITPLEYEPYILNLWGRTEKKIALWVQGQLLLGVIIGVLTFIGLSIAGIEYALLLAVLAAVFELVPFGLIFATIPALAIAFMTGGVVNAFIVLAIYVVIQQLENYVIAPQLVKRVTGVPPLIVIIALLIGAKLAGFWGVILAVPSAVLVMELLRDFEKRKTKTQ